MGVSSVLEFPFREACLLEAGGLRLAEISWGLHHLRGSPQLSWMGMLSGRWGFWISLDSLAIWVDAFLWEPSHLAGVCEASWLVFLLACLALWAFCW